MEKEELFADVLSEKIEAIDWDIVMAYFQHHGQRISINGDFVEATKSRIKGRLFDYAHEFIMFKYARPDGRRFHFFAVLNFLVVFDVRDEIFTISFAPLSELL